MGIETVNEIKMLPMHIIFNYNSTMQETDE